MFWNNLEEEYNYWISYMDLVMGLFMVFIVVFMVFFSWDFEQVVFDGKYRELFEVFQNVFGEMEGIQVMDDVIIIFVLNDILEKELFLIGDYYFMEYMQQLFKDFIFVYYNELYKIYNNLNDIFNIKEIRVEGYIDLEYSYYVNLRLFF